MRTVALLLMLVTASLASAPAGALANVQVIILFRNSIPSELNATLLSEGATYDLGDANLAFVLASTSNPAGLEARMNARSDVDRAYQGGVGTVLLDRNGTICRLDGLGAPDSCATTYPTGLPLGNPNDPAFNQQCGDLRCQWGLDVARVPSAWGISGYGSRNVTIAVLDTGIDATHPDLGGNVKMVGPFPGINQLAPGTAPIDNFGHGTFVAGIAAAVTNNAVGMAGIAQSSILAVKVCDDSGWCKAKDVALGIEAATLAGADVIDMSFGFGPDGSPQGVAYDALLDRALNFSYARGVLLVAAAGNGNQDKVLYPAAHPNVIAVSGVNAQGQFASSNYGAKIELAAPAGAGTRDHRDVYSTLPGGGYGLGHGTSVAVPHVGAVAALAKARHPSWTGPQIRACLVATASPVGTVPNDHYGHGIVNAAGAMTC